MNPRQNYDRRVKSKLSGMEIMILPRMESFRALLQYFQDNPSGFLHNVSQTLQELYEVKVENQRLLKEVQEIRDQLTSLYIQHSIDTSLKPQPQAVVKPERPPRLRVVEVRSDKAKEPEPEVSSQIPPTAPIVIEDKNDNAVTLTRAEQVIHEAVHSLPSFTFRIEVVSTTPAGKEALPTPDLVTKVHVPSKPSEPDPVMINLISLQDSQVKLREEGFKFPIVLESQAKRVKLEMPKTAALPQMESHTNVMTFKMESEPKVDATMTFETECQPQVNATVSFETECQPQINNSMTFETEFQPQANTMTLETEPQSKTVTFGGATFNIGPDSPSISISSSSSSIQIPLPAYSSGIKCPPPRPPLPSRATLPEPKGSITRESLISSSGIVRQVPSATVKGGVKLKTKRKKSKKPASGAGASGTGVMTKSPPTTGADPRARRASMKRRRAPLPPPPGTAPDLDELYCSECEEAQEQEPENHMPPPSNNPFL